MENTPKEKVVPVGQTACEKCGATITIPVNISVENLKTISMILWTHEQKITCPGCGLEYVPRLNGVNTSHIQWGIAAIEEKPLIERPGMIDISGRKIN